MLAAMLEGAEPRYHHLEDAPGCRRCCGQVAPALTAIMLVCVGLASSNLRPDAVAAADAGSFDLSTEDNGISLREFWRIVDAHDDLDWVVMQGGYRNFNLLDVHRFYSNPESGSNIE